MHRVETALAAELCTVPPNTRYCITEYEWSIMLVVNTSSLFAANYTIEGVLLQLIHTANFDH